VMDLSAAPIAIGLVGVAVLLVSLLAWAIVTAVRRERARRAALQAWAARYGWKYYENPRTAWQRRMPGRGRVHLMLSGVLEGFAVSVADYSYTETRSSTTSNADGTSSTSTSSTTYHYVAVVVRLPYPAPVRAVQPRHGLSKLGRALFGDRATAIGYEPF